MHGQQNIKRRASSLCTRCSARVLKEVALFEGSLRVHDSTCTHYCNRNRDANGRKP